MILLPPTRASRRLALIAVLFALTASALFTGTPAGAVSGGATPGEAAPAAVSSGRVFSSSFESISDFDGFYIEPPGHMGTAWHEQSVEQVHSGTYAHKGWIYGANPPSTPTVNNGHRGYPTIQLYKTAGGGYVCPCDITLWVWLDMPLDDPGEWFSFATLSSNATDAWAPVFGVNISAPNPAPGTAPGGVVHLMHVPDPGLREPTFQTSTILFPMRQWVELKIRVDYDPDHGHAEVWQDGQLVSAAPVHGGNGKLEQAHFGLYAAPEIASGVVFNDDLEIRELIDTDGDGVPDHVDNCPLVANPGQENSDNAIDNGPGILADDGTVPYGVSDTTGDACDPGPDIDHDRLPNSEDTEPLGATGICAGFAGANDLHNRPAGGDITNDDNGNGNAAPSLGTDGADDGPSWDTDNDGVLDGAECFLGTNPRDRLNRPSMTQCGGNTDADGDGLTVAAEKCKWGTSDGTIDTDGDGLTDCVEANDTNGDGVQNFPGDTINSARSAMLPAGTGPGQFGKTMDFDLNGDGAVNFPGDTILSAKMVNHLAGICT